MRTAQAPSSPSTYGRSPVRTAADEGVELGLERLVGLDLDLEHVARERRRIARR